MRAWAGLLLVGSVGCSGCLGEGIAPPSTGEDGAQLKRDGGIWAPDGAAGISVLARGVMLPPAWQAEAADLDPGAAPGLHADMRVRVEVDARVRTEPCAVPSGSYCDGFAAVNDAGHLVAVDTYAYLGAKPACRVSWVDGATVSSLEGIWQQQRNGSVAQSVLALGDCAGFNGPEVVGGTPAAPSTDIRELQSSWGPGLRVSVRGVVVARWKSSSGAFGFALQDPDGAPRSGVRVVRSKSSSTPAAAPEVGDFIQLTARTGTGSERVLEL
jgi:hypothetical protein